MNNEQSRNETLFTTNNMNEVIKKIGNDFNKLNNKFIDLLEENQMFKQENKNLLKKNQEILNNNFNLKAKLQERDKKIEKLQQQVINLEKEKNEGIKQLEIISQNLINNLEILGLNEINENDINTLKEKNIFYFNKINGHHNVDNSYLNINVDNKNHHNHNVPIVQVIESSSSSSFGNQPYYGQKRKLKKNIQPEIEDKNLKLSEVQIWFRQINESPQAQEAAKKIQGWFRKIRGRQQDHFPDKTYNDMRDFCRNVHDWEFSMKQKGKNVVQTLRCSTKHKEANIEWLNSKLQEAEDIIDQVSEWMNECS
ncbi:hypothetical protein RclHR1_01240015 [Rhizophagus clarus]|uniref:Uncharacterized protein n=1 Tax=Rhizophagus clarus TaxID=94130 RepID=A0A2Z6QM53_9GLOM|nr:hypothetical protein RclHR1_01240015 [Rhizophagus clarus]